MKTVTILYYLAPNLNIRFSAEITLADGVPLTALHILQALHDARAPLELYTVIFYRPDPIKPDFVPLIADTTYTISDTQTVCHILLQREGRPSTILLKFLQYSTVTTRNTVAAVQIQIKPLSQSACVDRDAALTNATLGTALQKYIQKFHLEDKGQSWSVFPLSLRNILPMFEAQQDFELTIQNPTISEFYITKETSFNVNWLGNPQTPSQAGKSADVRKFINFWLHFSGLSYAPVLLSEISGDDPEVGPEVRKLILPLASPKWRTNGPKGILFHGPPGTGKTHVGRKILDLLKAQVLFSGSASELNQKYVGEAERKLRELAAKARDSPHILFGILLDEVHTLADSQKSVNKADHKQDMLTQLLAILGSDEYNNILFIACTNFKSKLDDAFLRSNRMSKHVLMKPYSYVSRWNYFFGLSEFVDKSVLNQFLLQTTNFTIAQLNEVKIEVENTDFAYQSTHTGGKLAIDGPSLASLLRTVADTSELTRGPISSALHATATEKHHTALLKFIYSYLKISSGRMVCFLPSKYFAIEKEFGQSMFMKEIPAAADPQLIDLIVQEFTATHKLNFVRWIDGSFRDNTDEAHYEKSLQELLELARAMEKSLLIFEVDDLVGLVPASYQTGVNNNTSVTDTVGSSEGVQHTQGTNWGKSYSQAWGASWSDSTTHTTSTTTSVGVNLSKTPGINISASKTTSDSTTHTAGGSTTKTEGSSAGGSESTSNSASTNKSRAVGEGVVISSSVTVQMQYPKLLHAVIRTCGQVNRRIRPTDPYIILLYKFTQPMITEKLHQLIELK